MKISQEVREFAKAQSASASLTEAEAEAAMEVVSERFHEVGGKLYIGVDGLEHE